MPLDDPEYTLRRVWLTPEGRGEGFYFGFSNEGLWPLCHIAHTRPIFRAGRLGELLEVNQKFADTVVLERSKDTEAPRGARAGLSLRALPRAHQGGAS